MTVATTVILNKCIKKPFSIYWEVHMLISCTLLKYQLLQNVKIPPASHSNLISQLSTQAIFKLVRFERSISVRQLGLRINHIKFISGACFWSSSALVLLSWDHYHFQRARYNAKEHSLAYFDPQNILFLWYKDTSWCNPKSG